MSAVGVLATGDALRSLRPRSKAAFAACWLLLCLPWLTGMRVLPHDAAQQFFPAVGFVAGQLRHMQAPWWNPWLYGGYPQVADPQMMSMQPSMVLPMLLAPTSLHWFSVVVMLHLLVGGLGALRLGRLHGLRPAPQLLFALVFLFGGVASSRLQHTPMIVSYCVLPWLWLWMARLRRDGQWRHALLAGLAGALVALQLTQVTYFIIIACGLYALMTTLAAAPGQRLAMAARYLLVAAVAAVLSAPQWLSTLAYLPFSNRAALMLEDSRGGGIGWDAVSTLVAGNIYGQARGSSWALGELTTSYLYVGAVPLALWVGWGGAVLRRRRREALTALAVVLFSVLFALGLHTPLYVWCFSVLPGLDLFRRPSDILFMAVPAMAWLAAQALQAATDGERFRLHRPTLAVIVILLVQALWLGIAAGKVGPALASVIVCAGMGGAAVRIMRRRVARHPALLVVALLLADLAIHHAGARFNGATSSRTVITARHDGAAQNAYRMLQALPPAEGSTRHALFNLPALTNGAALHGIALVNGYNPLLAADYTTMVGMPQNPQRVDDMARTDWAPDWNSPLYDLLGLHWVLASEPFAGAGEVVPGQVYGIERTTALPRVLAPVQVRRHADALPTPADFTGIDFRHTVLLHEGVSSACTDQQAAPAQVQLRLDLASRLMLDVVATAASWVVVSDPFAPGWQADVDGVQVPLLRANGLFRAVCVPAGRHVVTLWYSPLQLWREGLAARGLR